MKLTTIFGLLLLLVTNLLFAAEATRPNILWFVVDDMSAHFSCYGETLIETPHVDQLAREGLRFTDAHVTAPVCSTCRSAFMTGMHQASVGVHHHRSGRDRTQIKLPDGVVPIPQLFQDAGYYTCNGSGISGKQRTKTDYNFVWDKQVYDATDWRDRAPGQPFFMQVQMAGGKLRGANKQSFNRTRRQARDLFGNHVDATDVKLPVYYPSDPVLLEDWAAYLDSVRLTDHHVGQVVDRLREEGLLDSTLIVFMTDHGISHARGKQFLFHEGTHIPFIVRGPGVAAGRVRTDPVEHIDMAALSLAAAGIPIPEHMQAKNVLDPQYEARKAVFSARDRCDETVEFMRSVRSNGLLYIRNYNPFRPHLQPSRYKDGKAIVKRLRQLFADDKLTALQKELLFRPTRPAEELYDTANDPHETVNLATHPEYAEQLQELRELLDRHLIATFDAGFIPEPLLSEVAQDPSRTVFDFVRSDDYPIAQIVALANLATRGMPEDLPRITQELDNSNPVMRYWAITGLLCLGTDARPMLEMVERAVEDTDASVRITAAAVLGRLGATDRAAKRLLREAREAQTDAHSLWALDGIKFLDTPDVIRGVAKTDVVRGAFSDRCYEFLSQGGLVYPVR